MRGFLLGVLITLLLETLGGVLFLKLGLFPVEADARPSALETKLATMALNASLARRAPLHRNSEPTEENLRKGLMLYKMGCSDCHGLPAQDSVYGRSFYPPAPQFAAHPPGRSLEEIHYILRHGIRNTGMAAWGKAMQERQMRDVAVFLRHLNSLPPSVNAEWRKSQK